MYDDVSHNFDFGPIFADAPGVLAKVYKAPLRLLIKLRRVIIVLLFLQ